MGTMRELVWCDYDGDPAVLLRRGDGVRIGYIFCGGRWHTDRGITLDVFTKGAILGREAFVRIFGELPPPPI
jgi:hypothetical protein